MKALIIAIGFMTRLPIPQARPDNASFGASMRWFPAAGLIVGLFVWAAAWSGAHVDPLLGALLALVVWAAITGALHLDGLGDIADATGGAHRDPERLQEILADPRAGTFAVVAIGSQLLAKFVLLALLLDKGSLWPLVVIPALARLGTLVWNTVLPQLGAGLASRFADAVRPRHIAGWSVPGLAAAFFAPALAIAPLLWFAWALWLRRRIGGISGDGHGAGIELTESGLLLALVIAA